MHIKRRNSWPPDVSALDALMAETPSGKNRCFKCIVYKTNKNIMKYQLYMNASKNNL